MPRRTRYTLLFTGLSGLSAVIMGAAAAHKAHDPYAADLLREASFYQLVHSVALLTLSQRNEWPARLACLFFASGMILFCGGLCVKAFAGASFLSGFIPFGGGCLMLGWLAIAAIAFRKSPSQGA